MVLPIKASRARQVPARAPRPSARTDLARAIALDTLDGALDCPLVAGSSWCTSDPAVGRRRRRGAGARRSCCRPGAGLDRRGRGPACAARDAAARRAVAVLLADLPALRAEDLDRRPHGRAAAPGGRRAGPAEGTGTVLLAAAAADRLRPAFGRARRPGTTWSPSLLDLDLPRLRRDVDTAGVLRTAVALGVGPRDGGRPGRRAPAGLA